MGKFRFLASRRNDRGTRNLKIYHQFKIYKTMNTLTCKDFIGTVNFSEEDGVFFGKIEGIDGLVNFEGESVNELTSAFHEAVDDYIANCEEEGIPEHSNQ